MARGSVMLEKIARQLRMREISTPIGGRSSALVVAACRSGLQVHGVGRGLEFRQPTEVGHAQQ
jgi:hypothetical protein